MITAQENKKLYENYILSEKDLINFLNSSCESQGIKLKLCDKCDSPSSKNHQGIWCDNCPGQMVDRSKWIIKNAIERSEKIIYLNKKNKNWWQYNLANLVSWYLVSKLVKSQSEYNWGSWEWGYKNREYIVGIYKKLKNK